jgi:2-polyprenyl-3-methyl-5-hydroxy-6-metoxy-1,4-benzoquinol methylase
MNQASSAIKLEFGTSQRLTSERMKKSPFLSKMVHKVFGYTNVGNWARSLVVIKLFKRLPLQNYKKIMDVGAGLGEFSFMLSKALPDVQITALEIWKERAEILKETVRKGGFTNVTVYDNFIETLPEKDTYDFIFAIDVFEHIWENEMPFKACLDKLKPGGRLLVKIPNIQQINVFPQKFFKEHQDWLDDEHVGQIYDLDGLAARFEKEGFTVEYKAYSDGWFSRLGWEIGYFSKKGGSVSQLAFLPLCKLCVYIDRMFGSNLKKGNAIQVIGVKK